MPVYFVSLKRLALAGGCVLLLCGLVSLAEDSVPSAPAAPAVTVPAVQAAPAPAALAADVRPLSRKEYLGDYMLAWSDEFDGDKLDPALWDCRTDSRYWSAQHAENVTVSGGYLHLALKKEKSGKMDYTAGGVISKRTFREGYYEARIKCPAGKGWHTSFSMTAAHKADVLGARQEINVCDTDSIDLKLFTTNLQIWKPAHRVYGPRRVKTPDLSSDFHVWGAEFTATKVRFFFEGDLVASMDANEFVHDEQSIWLSCFAAPLAKTFHVDDEKLPAEVLVDWVRFYEKKK